MPLIIPPRRNMSREGLTAYMIGLQEQRIRDEQQKAIEEAAGGGGAAGAGAGAVSGASIGTAIAPGWGTLIGAVVGAGVGYYTGEELGGQAPGLLQGLGAAGTGIVEGFKYQAGTTDAQIKRGEEIEPGTPAVLGILRSDVTDYIGVLSSALPGEPADVDRQTARRELVNIRSRQLDDLEAQRTYETTAARLEATQAHKIGTLSAKAEEKKKKLYQSNPDAFLYNPAQSETRRKLEARREFFESMPSDFMQAVSESPVSPEERLEGLRTVRRAEDAFAVRLKQKQPQMRTYSQLMQSGEPFSPGIQYAYLNPRTQRPMGGVSFTDKGTPSFVPDMTDPENLWFEIDGAKYTVDKSFKLAALKGEPTSVGGMQLKPSDVSKVADQAANALEYIPVLGPKGEPVLDKDGVPKERLATAEEKRAAGKAAVYSRQETLQELPRRQIVLESETSTEYFAKMRKEDSALDEALTILSNPADLPGDVVADAVRTLELHILEIGEKKKAGLDVPQSLLDDLREWLVKLERIRTDQQRKFALEIQQYMNEKRRSLEEARGLRSAP